MTPPDTFDPTAQLPCPHLGPVQQAGDGTKLAGNHAQAQEEGQRPGAWEHPQQEASDREYQPADHVEEPPGIPPAVLALLTAAVTVLESPGEEERELLREIFTEISGQSLRAGSIVRRLRDFVARGDTAKTVEDLPSLINEASALALVGSRERGISAQFHYDPEATPVLADRVQIQQVLINLMRNAMEAMEGCPERKLSVATALLDAETVQVSVRDTGAGIAPEMAERLFEAFASTKSSGMGLGLSICRTIVEAHGGRIRTKPAEGGGTEFQFTLLRPRLEEA